jgi:hypothetical protein
MKVPVMQTRDFDVFYELHDGHTWIHCDVRRYNKSVRNELIVALKLLMAIRETALYAVHEIDDKKHQKFITKLGFKYLQSNLCTDGKQRDIYIKEVN